MFDLRPWAAPARSRSTHCPLRRTGPPWHTVLEDLSHINRPAGRWMLTLDFRHVRRNILQSLARTSSSEPRDGGTCGGGMTARQQAIFTLDELATYLKVGKRTLYRLAAHGEIPAFKVGGTWRFRQSEIDRWINDQIQAGRKKEVMRTDEQPKSAKHPVLPGRAIHSRRQTD